MKAIQDLEKKKKESSNQAIPSDGTSEPTESDDKTKQEIAQAIKEHQKTEGKI